jgi:lipopolysaccharide/colanic/teichoic acid biosynthesis glycosyltransferase
MKTTLVIALFVAIVARLMADEVKAWSGWAHKKIRRRAVAKLPVECRDRYDEEWESGLEEIPGELFKIIYSIGLLRAAYQIRGAALKSTVRTEVLFSPLKRLFDIAMSGITLLALAPAILAISLGVKLNSHGPIFFSSDRIGKNGRVLRCLKFRTMARVTNVIRITKLGRFLRKYSLDELPLLFNVLRGDLSIVGPRPLMASELESGSIGQRRLDVTPGITGLWQLQSRKDQNLSYSKVLDDAYVNNWSVWLDFKILLRTILFVLAGQDSDW